MRFLQEEGFTKGEIAQRLGKKTRALQLHKDRVVYRNAAAVSILFQRVMQ